MDCVDVVVLAGGINHIALFEGYTAGYKALLPFNDRPAIHYTLEALRGAPQIGRICIVGPEDELREAVCAGSEGRDYAFVPGGDTMLDSVSNGLRSLADSPAVLVTTADLPLLTGAAITEFLAACTRVKTRYPENIFISAVPEANYTGAYQAFPKPFNRFRDVAVCHGNLMLMDPRLLRNTTVMNRMNRIYSARKSPITSALAIGWQVGLSYVLGVHLLHVVTLQRMARIASRQFKIGFIPILLPYPEITIDVDEAADYAFVKAQLESRDGHA